MDEPQLNRAQQDRRERYADDQRASVPWEAFDCITLDTGRPRSRGVKQYGAAGS